MRKILPPFLAVPFVLACSDSFTTAPHDADASAPALSASKQVVESVTGSGHFRTAFGELRTFSFAARRHADGTVSGEWQRNTRDFDAKAHGDITCFTIDGNGAWLGGVAERTTTAAGEVAWRVVDNGQGASAAPDQISLQFVGAGAGFAANYCATTPPTPALNDVEAGNIDIKN